jgi:cytochrome b
VPVRVLHWSLAAGIAAGWFTRHSAGSVHEWVGYAAWAAVVARVAWGFSASPYARFGQFVRTPGHTGAYLRALLAGRAPRYLGHNPLGGWMSVALWVTAFAVCLTGWMYTTDRWWGVAWVGDSHLYLTWALLGMVALHLGGVVFSSLKHRENLVGAMVHGRKRPAAPGDVD